MLAGLAWPLCERVLGGGFVVKHRRLVTESVAALAGRSPRDAGRPRRVDRSGARKETALATIIPAGPRDDLKSRRGREAIDPRRTRGAPQELACAERITPRAPVPEGIAGTAGIVE